jgi:hypothetical protein
MDDRLLPPSGVQFAANCGYVVVRRPRIHFVDVVLTLPFLLGGTGVALVMLWVLAKVATLFVAQPSFLLLVLMLVFSLALIPGTGALLWAQGLVFAFVVRIDSERLRYRLSNGLILASLALPAHGCVITVYPVHSRGDWGYAACLRRSRRGLPWPVVPAAIVGSKSKARREAQESMEWLRTHLGFAEVRLEKWDASE